MQGQSPEFKTVISSLNKFSNLSKTYVMDTSQSCKANILYTSESTHIMQTKWTQIAKDALGIRSNEVMLLV